MKAILILISLISTSVFSSETITNTFKVNVDDIISAPSNLYRLGNTMDSLYDAESFVEDGSVEETFDSSTDSKVSTETVYLKKLDKCMYSMKLYSVEHGHGYRADISLRTTADQEVSLQEVTECIMKHKEELNQIELKTVITK